MAKTPKLSTRQIQVLSKLAEGYNYEEIQAYFGLSPANVNVICHGIRKKTGIRQTLNQEECRQAFAALPPAKVAHVLNADPFPKQKQLTFWQLEALRLLAAGHTYERMAEIIGTRPQSVQNLVSRACKRACITAKGWNRPQHVRAWLKRYVDGPDEERADPMSDPAF